MAALFFFFFFFQSRDEWGFDWLSQFFAQRGFAVLQPNFRGSAGYGGRSGSPRTASAAGRLPSATCDAARWLVA